MDRNIPSHWIMSRTGGSLSARRAWIEIKVYIMTTIICTVALRKESVDRNDFPVVPAELTTLVALRKESVDRNFSRSGGWGRGPRSLSARRAWIEIRG